LAFTGLYVHCARCACVEVSCMMLCVRPVRCWPQQLSISTLRLARDAEKSARTDSISVVGMLCSTVRRRGIGIAATRAAEGGSAGVCSSG